QEGYFLTTTVHALIPEFDSGTRTPWIEGTTDRGRVTFTRDGAKVDHNGIPGTVEAGTADILNDVRASTVKGRSANSGWIDFPDTGITVHHGPNQDLGLIDAAGVNTTWVGDRTGAKGWIGFSQPGATVYKGGTQDRGTLSADKIDVNGLNTKWVGDQDGGNGWIEFPESGLSVLHGRGRDRGTVSAHKADLDDLVTGTALVKKRLTVKGGMTVSEGKKRALFTHPNGYVGIDTGMEVKGREGYGYVFRVNEGGEYGVLVNGPLAVSETIYVWGKDGAGGRFL
ncbi:hypothetical protein, partial [Streptomyces olivaceoviridis]|uniref:hypothetical protein n=1 Tax=Streptomyces olivaceoviridis TaxID=1921 RepID=UPI0036F8E297